MAPVAPPWSTADDDEIAYAAPIATGFVIAFVGFASSFAVVLKGLTAVGASDLEAASGVMALSLAMGIATLLLAFAFKAPIVAAWSTPGGALLAATGAVNGGFPAAVGAFLAVGILLAAAGLIKPFARLVAAIPSSLANAMLAGILFGLCLQPIKALIEVPIPAAIVIRPGLLSRAGSACGRRPRRRSSPPLIIGMRAAPAPADVDFDDAEPCFCHAGVFA